MSPPWILKPPDNSMKQATHFSKILFQDKPTRSNDSLRYWAGGGGGGGAVLD